MSVTLPGLPSFVRFTPRIVSASTELTPPAGGVTQHIHRLGDRFAVDVVLPKMLRSTGDVWFTRLALAKLSTALFDWPLPLDGVGTPGAPLVNGAGQAGMTLNIDGLTPGYVMKEGQPFSIVHAGVRYLHRTAAETAANGSGQIALPLYPMLRVSPSDNAVVEIAQPKIEGKVRVEDLIEPLDLNDTVDIAFSITERR